MPQKKQLSEVKKDELAEALIIRTELARIFNDLNKEAQCYELLVNLDVPADRILEL